MESLISQLKCRDQREIVLKALLDVFSDDKLCSSMRKLAVDCGLVKALVVLLRQDWGVTVDDINTRCDQDCLSLGNKAGPVGKEDSTEVEGRSESCRSSDLDTVLLALSCISILCEGSSARYPHFVDKHLINTLLGFVVSDPATVVSPLTQHRFFQFGSGFSDVFRRELEGTGGYVKILVEEPKPLPEKSRDRNTGHLKCLQPEQVLIEELDFYNPSVFDIQDMQDIKLCQVKTYSESGECNLAHTLVSEGVAWHKAEKMVYEEKSDRNKKNISKKQQDLQAKEDTFIPSKVTHILKGNFFWAIFGKDKLKLAPKVASELLKGEPKLVQVQPTTLDTVVARVQAESSTEAPQSKRVLVRAQVLLVDKADCTVRDIDSGILHQVSASEVFHVPPGLDQTCVPGLATLGSLTGVLPPPLDLRATDLALRILNLLVHKQHLPSIDAILHSSAMHALPSIILCPDPKVRGQALHLASRLMTHGSNFFSKVTPWSCLVPNVLSMLRTCMRKTTENLTQSQSKASPKNSPPIKESKAKKFKTAMNASSKDKKLGSCAVATTADAMGMEGADKGDKEAQCSNSVKSVESSGRCSPSPTSKGKSNCRPRDQAESCLAFLSNCLFRSSMARTKFCQYRGLETVIRAHLLYHKHRYVREKSAAVLAIYINSPQHTGTATQSSNEQIIKEILTQASPSKSCLQKICLEKTSSDSEVDSDCDETESGSDVPHVSTIHSPACHSESSLPTIYNPSSSTPLQKFYIRGEKVPFSHDASHELRSSATDNREDIASVLCGMLNTGRECSLYLGIDPFTSEVRGVHAKHSQRDTLRMEIDKCLSENISPSLFAAQYQMTFVPVLEMANKSDFFRSEDGTSSLESDSGLGEAGRASGEAEREREAWKASGETEIHPGSSVGVAGVCQTAERRGVIFSSEIPKGAFHLDEAHVIEVHVRAAPGAVHLYKNMYYHRLLGETEVLHSQLLRHVLSLEEEEKFVEKVADLEAELKELETMWTQMEDSESP